MAAYSKCNNYISTRGILMAKIFALIGIAIACTVGGMTRSSAQPLDVSDCFPEMLRQQRAFDTLTDFELHYLSTLDETEWKSSSKNGSVAVLGIVAGNYSQFDAERKTLFTENRLDVHYFQHLSSSSLTLDPAAYEVMKECLKVKAATQKKGLTYVVVVEDATDLSIRFFWNPTNPPYELPATGYIDNGKNIDPAISEIRQLFPVGTKITPDGPTIQIARTDPKLRVRVGLSTTPPTGIDSIRIDPPKPSPKYERVMVRAGYEDSVEPENYKTGEVAYNAVYDYKHKLDGDILSTTCAYKADYYHMESCSPSAPNEVHCLANKQRSNTRSALYISVIYLQPHYRCIENCGGAPEPFPGEEKLSNYSFDSKSVLADSERSCTWKAAKVSP